MIPAITIGITDLMINSGLRTAEAEIPMLAFAVPYDAPIAVKTIAQVAPKTPKNGE